MAVTSTTLEFPPWTSAKTTKHYVWVKRAWSDAWTYVPWLFCDQATWCCAPSIPTAQLFWDVGLQTRQGRVQAAWYSPLDLGRWFVLIQTEVHTAFPPTGTTIRVGSAVDSVPVYKNWYGSLEVTGETLEGMDVVGRKTGMQRITCYGLAQMLARTPLDGHWWAETANPSSTHFSPHPATFNMRDEQGRVSANRSTAGGLMFTDKVKIDDASWSSRSIVKYLLQHHTPRLTSDPHSFVFLQSVATGQDIYIPDWDTPTLSTSGKSVWQALCEILYRGRLLSFYLDVTAGSGGAADTVKLYPVSLADSDITTDGGTLVANQRQFVIKHHQDRACTASFRKNTLQAVDQFVLRGARRASIVSIGKQDPASFATLEKGWTSALETEYEAAGSGDAGYAAASTEEKQRRNNQSRSRAEVEAVYRRFQIPDNWTPGAGGFPEVYDGRGGGTAMAAFIKDSDRAVGVPINPREVRILPTLPIKDGYDYSAVSSLTLPFAGTRVSAGPHENLRPLVFFQIPDQTTRWVEASQLGKLGKEVTSKKQNHKFSCRVHVPQRDKAILLEVSGAEQHVIAYADFTKLAVDPYCGQWDWQKAVFTVAIEDDRYCEGKYPSDSAVSVHDTELRRVVIDVGDEYRQDYIAPHTALGVHKETGALTECTAGGYCRDDSKTLKSKAQLAWTYYSQGRNSLALACDRPTDALQLGDLVVSTSPGAAAGSDSVLSIVTQLTLSIPASNSSTVQEPVRFEIETGHAELDFLEHVLERNRLY
jgi:hypothetical protein